MASIPNKSIRCGISPLVASTSLNPFENSASCCLAAFICALNPSVPDAASPCALAVSKIASLCNLEVAVKEFTTPANSGTAAPAVFILFRFSAPSCCIKLLRAFRSASVTASPLCIFAFICCNIAADFGICAINF